MIVQLIAAFIGSIGFALMLKIRGKQIFYAGLGGLSRGHLSDCFS